MRNTAIAAGLALLLSACPGNESSAQRITSRETMKEIKNECTLVESLLSNPEHNREAYAEAPTGIVDDFAFIGVDGSQHIFITYAGKNIVSYNCLPGEYQNCIGMTLNDLQRGSVIALEDSGCIESVYPHIVTWGDLRSEFR